MILAGLVILSISATGCGEPCVMTLAPIHGTNIWADNSSPPQYFVDVVSGEPSACYNFNSCNVTRTGNTTVRVEVFNLYCESYCGQVYSYVEHNITLGSDFVPGVNCTVEVNDVTTTFVA
jgi:hypothetical protein